MHNLEFLRFAHHWSFTPRACRPYRAQTKGKVERPVRYLRDNFVYGRTFVNDADLDQQRRQWVDDVANVRVHGTTCDRPGDRFDRDERLLLQPLAPRPYTSLVLADGTTACDISSSTVTLTGQTLSCEYAHQLTRRAACPASSTTSSPRARLD